jgi:hypothetical protein
MKTRRLVPALLGLVLLAWPVVAGAQATPAVDQATVSLWPEFDRPEVLIIYRLRLAAAEELPARVAIPIPANLSSLNAVATRAQDGSLVNASYTQETSGDTTRLLVDSDSPDIQVEFYVPMERVGGQRSFRFTWPGGLAAASFVFDVQQPVEATEFTLTPPGESQAVGEFNLTYHRVAIGAIDETSTPTVSGTYNRTTDRLTSDFLGGQTPLGTPEAPGGRTPDLTAYLPYGLLALGLLLLAGGGIYYFRTARPAARPRPRHRRTSADGGDQLDASPVYCHNCGALASATDFFCRRCGTQLRR